MSCRAARVNHKDLSLISVILYGRRLVAFLHGLVRWWMQARLERRDRMTERYVNFRKHGFLKYSSLASFYSCLLNDLGRVFRKPQKPFRHIKPFLAYLCLKTKKRIRRGLFPFRKQAMPFNGRCHNW